jgi:epoxide hydrolase-like predicted phosphatase
MNIKNVIFDFERVFIKWEPFNIFKKYLKSKLEMDRLLVEINHQQISNDSDMGKDTFSNLIQKAAKNLPQYKDMLLDYDINWLDTISEVQGTVELAIDLKKAGYKIYGLSNFSTDKITDIYSTFDFHKHLDGMIVSAFVKVMKPDPEIYNLLCEKYNIKAQECIFFDDRQINVDGAKAVGMQAFVFTTPQKAREDLQTLGIKV